MIKLSRDRRPELIPKAVRGPALLGRCEGLLAAKDKHAIEWDPTFWRKAKPQLARESGGKCAYCEARTEVVAPGDVEHYRPKSIYWWLAYWYGNYLYACELCNRLYKRDLFPVEKRRVEAPGAAPPFVPDPACTDDEWRDYAARLSAEAPLLPNPYDGDPEQLFSWGADATLSEVTVAPAQQKGRGARLGRTAIKLYGLNRPELRHARWRRWRELQLLLDTRAAIRDRGLKAEIDVEITELTSSAADFAGMARFLVKGWPGTRAK